MVTFAGRCEKFAYESAPAQSPAPSVASGVASGRLVATRPTLRPSPASTGIKSDAFVQRFFVDAASGALYSRLTLRTFAGLEAFWHACYCRVDVGLVATPLASDAGADLKFVYPTASTPPLALAAGDLPRRLWPAPRRDGWSPFSLSAADYVRVVGPGVYVGCGYRCDRPGEFLEDNFVYFAIVKSDGFDSRGGEAGSAAGGATASSTSS